MLRCTMLVVLMMVSSLMAQDDPLKLPTDPIKREELPLPKTFEDPKKDPKKDATPDPKKENDKEKEPEDKDAPPENLPVRIIRVPVPPIPEPTYPAPFVYPTYTNVIGEWYGSHGVVPRHPLLHRLHR